MTGTVGRLGPSWLLQVDWRQCFSQGPVRSTALIDQITQAFIKYADSQVLPLKDWFGRAQKSEFLISSLGRICDIGAQTTLIKRLPRIVRQAPHPPLSKSQALCSQPHPRQAVSLENTHLTHSKVGNNWKTLLKRFFFFILMREKRVVGLEKHLHVKGNYEHFSRWGRDKIGGWAQELRRYRSEITAGAAPSSRMDEHRTPMLTPLGRARGWCFSRAVWVPGTLRKPLCLVLWPFYLSLWGSQTFLS